MSTQPTSALNIPPQVLPAINSKFDTERAPARNMKRTPKKQTSTRKAKPANRLGAVRKPKSAARSRVAKTAVSEKAEVLHLPLPENESEKLAAIDSSAVDAPITLVVVQEPFITQPVDLQPALTTDILLETAAETLIPAEEPDVYSSPLNDYSSLDSRDLSEPVEVHESEVSTESNENLLEELAVLPPVNETESLQAIATQRRSFLNLLATAWNWLQGKFKTHQERKRLRVCETVSLGEKRFVAVIQVDGEQFLVGGSSTSISTLAHLERRQEFADMLRNQGEQGLIKA